MFLITSLNFESLNSFSRMSKLANFLTILKGQNLKKEHSYERRVWRKLREITIDTTRILVSRE